MRKTFILLMMLSALVLQAQELTIATYNLRCLASGDVKAGNGWQVRGTHVGELIGFYDFDIFGTQEGEYPMLQDLLKWLSGYKYIGVGREDGTDSETGGEYAAIFYKTDRLELLDSGNFWLAEDTSKPVKGWDAECKRICTWGKFRDKQSGFVFVHYNLHMDHIGWTARAESAKLILRKIEESLDNTPTILTGDFNVNQNNDAYKLINESGIMRDAYETAEFRYAPNGTFNDYCTDCWDDERIDHLFLTPEFGVKRYGVLTNTYRTKEADGTYKARNPSDHYPVVIVVEEKI